MTSATSERPLHELGGAEAARLIRAGRIGSSELVQACLAHIERVEGTIQAFAFLDPEHALARARVADARRAAGEALGALHGVPVALKDIFDTAAMPTENGTVLHRGRLPAADAAVVTRLQAAGAIVLGKVVTAELAALGPGKTRNPCDPARTPGGSSSGSAAAVAAHMVPLALGSQTNGSTIRPASFCGVFGFKPTHGMISRAGMLRVSRSLDHVGLFARSIEDLAWLARALAGHDPADPDTRPLARQPFVELATSEPPHPPRFALIETPYFQRAEPAVHRGFSELSAALGAQVERVPLPAPAEAAWRHHQTIMEAEMAHSLACEWEQGREQLTPVLRAQIERGLGVSAVDYQRALGAIPELIAGFGPLLERYDAILTPAALGAAPQGLEATGDPVFCTPWSLCGMPALSLPLLADDVGMPIGVQVVGRRHEDARLLGTARWLDARGLAAARCRPT